MFPDRSGQYQQLDLNLLKLFEALYQEQNMSRAARRLHLTPSAVSHGIKRLRHALGDPLFIRHGHGMTPSPLAQRLAPQLLDNLARLRQLLNFTADFVPEQSQQEFRIGLHGALEEILLPLLTQRMSKLAPAVQLHSVRLQRESLAKDLSAGHIDCAIDVALPLRSPIAHQPVSQDSFNVLFDKDQHNGPMDAEHYLQGQHVAVSARATGAVIEDVTLQQMGLNRKVKVRCQSYQGALACLPDSALLLTMPALLIPSNLPKSIAVRPLPVDATTLHTHLYWHEHTQTDKALTWFRQQVVAVMALN